MIKMFFQPLCIAKSPQKHFYHLMGSVGLSNINLFPPLSQFLSRQKMRPLFKKVINIFEKGSHFFVDTKIAIRFCMSVWYIFYVMYDANMIKMVLLNHTWWSYYSHTYYIIIIQNIKCISDIHQKYIHSLYFWWIYYIYFMFCMIII